MAQSGTKDYRSISEVYAEIGQRDSAEITGSRVTVRGTATFSTGVLHEQFLESFIQDGTGGISIFADRVATPFEAGDSLVVTGEIQRYYGMVEIRADSYEVFSAAEAVKPADLREAIKNPDDFSGMLVSGEGVIVEKGTLYSGQYLRIAETDTSGPSIMVYVSNSHSEYQSFDFQTPAINDEISVTGVIGEYDPDYPDSRTFMLHLRSPSDIEYVGFPRYYLILLIIGLFLISVAVTCWVLLLKSRVRSKTAEIQKALKEKETLLREVHHRVKNNLAIVAGLLELQMDNSENRKVKQVLKDGRSRIQSMALIHEKLYNTDSLSRIALHAYLTELTEAIYNTYNTYRDSVELNLDMEEVRVSVDQAIPCGLLINELITNAFKHAFTVQKGGELTVGLRKNGNQVTLTVADDGPGLPENIEPGERNSLGMMLIRTFSEQLSADMDLHTGNGTRFSFSFILE